MAYMSRVAWLLDRIARILARIAWWFERRAMNKYMRLLKGE